MADIERSSSQILTDIESADTPLGAVEAASQLSVSRLVGIPSKIGRDILRIVMNGDLGKMLGASADHL